MCRVWRLTRIALRSSGVFGVGAVGFVKGCGMVGGNPALRLLRSSRRRSNRRFSDGPFVALKRVRSNRRALKPDITVDLPVVERRV